MGVDNTVLIRLAKNQCEGPGERVQRVHEKCFALQFLGSHNLTGLQVVQDGVRGALLKDACLRGDLGTIPCLSYSNSDRCPTPANNHSRECHTFGCCLE